MNKLCPQLRSEFKVNRYLPILRLMHYTHGGVKRPLFPTGTYDDRMVGAIAAVLQPQFFLQHDYLCREGQVANCMWFLVNGNVEVLVGERETPLVKVSAHQFCGEMAVLGSEVCRRNASVRAKAQIVDVLTLTRDGLTVACPPSAPLLWLHRAHPLPTPTLTPTPTLNL